MSLIFSAYAGTFLPLTDLTENGDGRPWKVDEEHLVDAALSHQLR